jgi:hypothetical protein
MSLLNNAIESIQVGVEDYLMDDNRRYRSAVRNIFAGILLLYKEKLNRLSPPCTEEALIKNKIKFIYTDEGNVTFVGDGKNTVGVHEIKERFKSLNIKVDWNKFDKLNDLRNNIEHYYTNESSDAVLEVVATSFTLIQDFISEHLGEESHGLLGDECWQTLLDRSEVLQTEQIICIESFKKIGFLDRENFRDFVNDIECLSCSSQLIKVADGFEIFPSLICRACGDKFDFEELLSDNVDFDDESLAYCNDCEHHERSVGKLGEKWICFSCHCTHNEIEVGSCGYCNEFVAGNLEDTYLSGCSMCDGQMGHYMSSSSYD